MWYEILPSFGIIMIATALPGYALYGIHKLVFNNAFRRGTDERWDRMMYQRDFRLTRNPYLVNGLESIPDEPEK
uniref:NADH dehydrogenase [ubiquinone] 1 alpha subcomplex subunit 1 n=1 Tax=Phlebotomus kandelakii TaxID=1109342 RepID=A0A6B2EDG1_9DIPT